MKLFVDTNVVIDFLGQREPFAKDAAVVFDMHLKGMVQIAISSLTVVNCAYILRKEFSKEIMLEKVKWLCENLFVTPIDKECLVNASQENYKDFEDAVQYMSAMSFNPDLIITRNVKDFKELSFAVLTPSEFVLNCM